MTVSEGLPDGMQRFFSDLQGEMRAWAPMLWSRLQLWWWVGGRKVGCSVGGVNKLSEANHHKPVNNHNSKYPHIALPAAAVGGCIPLVSTHEPPASTRTHVSTRPTCINRSWMIGREAVTQHSSRPNMTCRVSPALVVAGMEARGRACLADPGG
jgi:hypothetical protein